MNQLTDMSKCTPASALSTGRKKGHWCLLPYDAEGVSGTMLGAGELTDAPDVTLPLGVSGWHGIHIGFWAPAIHEARPTIIKLKLTGDDIFHRIWHQPDNLSWLQTELRETFWTYADLTDRDLVIGQQKKGFPAALHIAYVKLEPLSPERVAALEQDRSRTDTRRVVALNDGCSFIHRDGCTTEEELLEQVELYRHSDVGTVSWAVNYGDATNYPSNVGTMVGTGYDDFETIGGRNMVESLRTLTEQGIVPFESAMRHVHSMGIKFHAQFRLGMLAGELFTTEAQGAFSRNHPEFRIVDRDGTALPKLSYAFPEVRNLMLSLIAEVLEHDVDGIDLCYIRGPMYVGYEATAIEDFKHAHGVDPREIDEKDERWIRHKADYVTQFARDVRTLVDDVSTRRGKKLEVAAQPYWTEALNLHHGLDVRTWLTEGLVDTLQMGPRDEAMLALIKAHNCELVANVGARIPENYVKFGLDGYDAGAVGIGIWDMNVPQYNPEHWEILRNLGHRDKVEAYAQSLPKMKTIKLKSVGGMDICHTTNKDTPENWPPEMITQITCG